MIKSILFVCTANLCRSPFAEYLFRKKAHEISLNLNADSCGINGLDGYSAIPDAVKIAYDFGIDMSTHLSKTLTKELLDSVDLVIVMGRDHRLKLLSLFPESKNKIKLLSDFSSHSIKGYDIMDPYGHGDKMYRIVFEDMEQCIDGLIKYICNFKS